MIVLGLNGRVELPGRVDGHDPSAALFVDGRLTAAVEEERFTRVRHASGCRPVQSTRWVLSEAGLSLSDVDVVALGWDPFRQSDYAGPDEVDGLLDYLLPPADVPRRPGHRPAVEIVPHHVAHAAGAFYSSPFRQAAVLVVDGAGEQESISWFRCNYQETSLIGSRSTEASLGFFYTALSQFVGLGAQGEGKTMGLAPYGRPIIDLASPLDRWNSTGPSTLENNERLVRQWIEHFEKTSGTARNTRKWSGPAHGATVSTSLSCFDEQHLDVAASGQERINGDLVELANMALRECEADNLVITGGVGLNCTANGVLARTLLPHKGFWVQPAANDAGVAIGAAAFVCAQGGEMQAMPHAHVYSGPSSSAGEVAEQLTALGIEFETPADPEAVVAEAIARNLVVARYEGRAEFGPRALGNRSLLAHPGSERMRDHVNRIKQREPWRPIAPSIAAELSGSLLGDLDPAPLAHMLVATPVTEARVPDVAAIVHVDGSTRPQVVSPETNPSYHRLLVNLHRDHGVPATINTSLNVRSPIVNSVSDALSLFFGSDIDLLALQGLVLRKENRR